jgi:hypothetical protein
MHKGWKSRKRGSSDFCQNPWLSGQNCQGGGCLLEFYCIFIDKSFEICLGGVYVYPLPPSPTPTPCAHLWLLWAFKERLMNFSNIFFWEMITRSNFTRSKVCFGTRSNFWSGGWKLLIIFDTRSKVANNAFDLVPKNNLQLLTQDRKFKKAIFRIISNFRSCAKSCKYFFGTRSNVLLANK